MKMEVFLILKRGILVKNIEVNLQKVVFEVRYDHAILFNELVRLDAIKKTLKKNFQHSQLENDTLMVINPEHLMNCVIQPERTAVDWDDPQSFSKFKNISIDSLDTIKRHLEIDELTRVGLRLFFHQELDDIEFAREQIKNKLLSTELRTLQGDLKRPAVAFLTENEHASFQVNVSAAATQVLNSTEIKFSIQYDIDVYINKTTMFDKINAFMTDGYVKAEQIANDLNNLILG